MLIIVAISISVRNPIKTAPNPDTSICFFFIQLFPPPPLSLSPLSVSETIFAWLLQKQTALTLISLSLGSHSAPPPPCDVKPRPLLPLCFSLSSPLDAEPSPYHLQFTIRVSHCYICFGALCPSLHPCSGLPSWSSVFLLLHSSPDAAAAGLAAWVNCPCCALLLLPAQRQLFHCFIPQMQLFLAVCSDWWLFQFLTVLPSESQA